MHVKGFCKVDWDLSNHLALEPSVEPSIFPSSFHGRRSEELQAIYRHNHGKDELPWLKKGGNTARLATSEALQVFCSPKLESMLLASNWQDKL